MHLWETGSSVQLLSHVWPFATQDEYTILSVYHILFSYIYMNFHC